MQAGPFGLSVVICTRNRPQELGLCLRSLSLQEEVDAGTGIEVLVVDDGELASQQLEEMAAMLPPWMSFHYYRKEVPGLFRSVRESLTLIRYPVVLFLDDDVELEPSYLCKLIRHYREKPELSGVGGVDRLLTSSWLWRCYARFFLYSSGSPGKLSLSGYGGSMATWIATAVPFQTEFLYGCNMSFRREALRDLPECEWLQGYSLGFDFYMTGIAARHGLVLVDPALGVLHHQAPASRDSMDSVAKMQIVNHAHMLKLAGGGRGVQICFYWTWLGLYLGTFLQGQEGKVRRRGYRRGLAQGWRIFGERAAAR